MQTKASMNFHKLTAATDEHMNSPSIKQLHYKKNNEHKKPWIRNKKKFWDIKIIIKARNVQKLTAFSIISCVAYTF